MPTSLVTSTISSAAPPPPPPPNNNDDDNNNGKKPAPPPLPDLPPPPALRCPRCDSANTKFCYYNNYSLSQPRHFCKTCRRYWTKGGALRNVPIGGGCRKSKKSRSAAPRLPSFSGIPPSVIDFSLSPYPQNFSILSSNLNRACGPVDVGHSLPAGSSLLDFTHPFPARGFMGGGGGASVGATAGLVGPAAAATNGGGADSSFLAASIESLSTLNQELHWKLQQQRMTSMLYNGGEGSSGGGSEAAASKPQPIFFQNLDAANPTNSQFHDHSSAGNDDQRTSMIGANQWLFDNSFGGPSGGGRNDAESDSGLNGGGGVSGRWSHQNIPPVCSAGPSGGGSNDGERGGGSVSGGWSHQIPPVCSAGWFEKGLK